MLGGPFNNDISRFTYYYYGMPRGPVVFENCLTVLFCAFTIYFGCFPFVSIMLIIIIIIIISQVSSTQFQLLINNKYHNLFVSAPPTANLSLLPEPGSDEHREIWQQRLREVRHCPAGM